MSYFSSFPLFRLSDNSLGMNITARTMIASAFKTNENAFYKHSIMDGETPEVIADKFYDDVELAWTILLFNDIHNIYTQWPLDQQSLEQYIDEKYPNPNAVHHYESLATNNIVGDDWPSYDRYPITNAEFEIAENDGKRDIKLILPELIGQVVSQHKELMQKGNI